MNRKNCKYTQGFTLIELILVIFLLSLTLYFAIPNFSKTNLFDSFEKTENFIRLNIRNLKEKSIQYNKQYQMVIDIDSDKIWIVHEQMDKKKIESAIKNAFTIPDDLDIISVAFLGSDKITAEQAQITFYKKGYSDHVAIIIKSSNNKTKSLVIEPFLYSVKITENII
jgi:prepilin-type N-terminal cleavage/methylation domain-containing protein